MPSDEEYKTLRLVFFGAKIGFLRGQMIMEREKLTMGLSFSAKTADGRGAGTGSNG